MGARHRARRRRPSSLAKQKRRLGAARKGLHAFRLPTLTLLRSGSGVCGYPHSQRPLRRALPRRIQLCALDSTSSRRRRAHEEDQARGRAWSSIDRNEWGGYAALRSSDLRVTTITSPRDGATSHATTRTANDTNARISISASLDLVRGFAVLRRVETEDFLALGDAQSDEDVDELQDHERHHGRVDDRRGHRDRLDAELSWVAVREPVLSAAVDRYGREDAGRERAPGAADAVDAEDVERIVDLEALRELDRGVAEDAGSESDQDRGRDIDVAGCGCDRDETCDRTGRGTEHTRGTLVQP